MKTLYTLLVALLFSFGTQIAFAQDIYFNAVAAATASGLASGTLTAGASPDQLPPLNNFSRLTSMQYGYADPITIGSQAGGGGSGKTSFKSLIITKNVDLASNKLIQAGFQGTHLASAQILYVSTSSGNQIRYKVDLEDAYITDYTTSVANGSCTGCIAETYTIVYAKIRITTYTQSNSGVVTANTPAQWDQTKNTATF